MVKSYYPMGGSKILAPQQWSAIARNWFGTGTIKFFLNELLVYADSTGMNAKVKSGAANLLGHLFMSDAEEVLAIAAASTQNPRIDRVIIRLDYSYDSIDLAVLQGTPAVSPVPPALTQNATRWEISLAQVYVAKSVATIAPGNITDERVFAGNDYNDDITYFSAPSDGNASGDLFPNGITYSQIASGTNYPSQFGTLMTDRYNSTRMFQMFFGTGSSTANTFAPYYRMWYNGAWTPWTQLAGLTPSGILSVPNQPGFSIVLGTGNLSVPANTDTLLPFSGASGNHGDTAMVNGVYTAPEDGVYLITATTALAAAAGASSEIKVYKNGTISNWISRVQNTAGSTYTIISSGIIALQLAKNDTVKIYAFSSAAATVDRANTNLSTAKLS